MPAQTAGRGRLTARRLALHYLVARDDRYPHVLQRRLDQVLRARLPLALGDALRPRLAASDPSIWLIRRLEADLAVNVAWDAERLARTVAGHLARAVGRAIAAGGDGVSVIRFANPAEYLARFVDDLADGHAWTRWYYARFDGLRRLPRSAALRTALAIEPAVGLAALAFLSPPRRALVLEQLTPADATRLLAGLAAVDGRAEEGECLEGVWQAYRALGHPPAAGREERLSLRLYIESFRARPALAGPPLADAAGRLVRLARLAETAPRRLAAAQLQAAGPPAALWSALPAADAEALAPLLRGHARWTEAVTRELERARRGSSAPVALTGESAATLHGGVFLLLPVLATLPLDEATAGWPAAGQTAAAALVRLSLLAACLGPDAAPRVLGDSLVRELAGLGPTLSQQELRDWLVSVPADRVRHFTSTLAAWQREQGAVTSACGVLAHARTRAGATLVALDCARGVWAAAAISRAPRPAQAVRRLTGWLTGPSAPARLVCPDAMVAAALRRLVPTVEFEPVGAEPPAGADDELIATLARVDRLESDLTHVTLAPPLGAPRPLGLALALAAQGVLRALAWRLPGFARASLAHLHANFLDVRASVEEEATRRVVRMSRAPLHLVLSMTGMTRASFTLPWLDGRMIALYPDESS